MPTADAILWAAISGLILLMLAIIGYLLSTGFASIKAEFSKLWDKFDLYQKQG
jgi:zinc transporter ZupT